MVYVSYHYLTYARSILDWRSVSVDFDKNIIGIGRTQNSHISTPLVAYVRTGVCVLYPHIIHPLHIGSASLWGYVTLVHYSKYKKSIMCHYTYLQY